MASDSLINNLINKFGTKPVAKQIENSESVQNGVNKKKTKELKVLDPKAAQNLSILLGKIWNKIITIFLSEVFQTLILQHSFIKWLIIFE